MNINFYQLLTHNDILLLFVILAIGLSLGKIRIAGFQLGNSIGVLVTSLAFGHYGFDFSSEALTIGFMFFIFAVGIEAGPNFFSVFFRDGKSYLVLSFTVITSAISITYIIYHYFGVNGNIATGMMAGAMTATPLLVGAKDALNSALSGELYTAAEFAEIINNLSVGYALAYLVGLVSMVMVANLLPKLQKEDLEYSAQKIAIERGLGSSSQRKVYLPIIRAYRVGAELINWVDGRNLRELGIHRQTGCYIERIRRNRILATPDGDAILQEGDEIALVGYPDSHARLDSSFRHGKEVFDRDLLDLRVVEEQIVVKNNLIVGKRLSDLNLSEYGCFLNRVVRAQVEMPLDHNILLAKGDILQVSGEKRRVMDLANHVGFIAIHSQVSDMLAFCGFFIIGLIIGLFTLTFGNVTIGLGNASGLLIAGILLGFLRANHPTFGYIPQGAINIVKELGLMTFMVGVGLNAGDSLWEYFQQIGFSVMIGAFFVSVIPVTIAYFVGAYILKMNRALLLGALMGARTCAPAMDIINQHARSTIPALGYAGTYAIANMLLTLSGTMLVTVFK